MVYVCYLCHQKLPSEAHFNHHMEYAHHPSNQNEYVEAVETVTDVISERSDGNECSRGIFTYEEVRAIIRYALKKVKTHSI